MNDEQLTQPRDADDRSTKRYGQHTLSCCQAGYLKMSTRLFKKENNHGQEDRQ